MSQNKVLGINSTWLIHWVPTLVKLSYYQSVMNMKDSLVTRKYEPLRCYSLKLCFNEIDWYVVIAKSVDQHSQKSFITWKNSVYWKKWIHCPALVKKKKIDYMIEERSEASSFIRTGLVNLRAFSGKILPWSVKPGTHWLKGLKRQWKVPQYANSHSMKLKKSHVIQWIK